MGFYFSKHVRRFSMLEQLKEQWDNILLHVKEEHDIMDVSFNTWLLPLKIFAVDGNVVKILAPDAQMLRYIQKKYGLILQVSIEEVTGFACTLDFITEDDVKEKEKPEKMLIQNTPGDVSQTALQNANLNPRYTFDTFVVGANNNLAHAAALAVAESPGEVYNPLFIYGGVGLGKTHLMHSIAHFILKNNPEAKILYVTSEKFTNELIDAIRNKNNISTTEFREKYRNNDVLLIDDMVDTAGTITKAANLMLENGAKSVRAIASHAVMSDPASTRVDQSALTEMIFTDSIPYAKKCEKVKVLSVADMFAEAIRRVCSGESISSLYTI